MSTIVYSQGVMAADSVMSWCDDLSYGIEKVGRTENYLFGYAGRLNYMRPVYQWVKQLDNQDVHPQDFYQHRGEIEPYVGGDADSSGTALIVDRKGVIWVVTFDGFAAPMDRAYDAVGSGSRLALGALEAGATAKRAVEIACIHDAYSDGAVKTWTFDQPVYCPNEKES